MRKISFHKDSFDEFLFWRTSNQAIFDKILTLIQSTARNPFEGIGKPEPLKNELQGFWSRRINKEHRLVYQVKDNEIVIISCRYHY